MRITPTQVAEGSITTGFAGLDAMTQGLRHRLVAVPICALDSSPTRLLQGMVASLCSVEGGRIASSRLRAEKWPRLGEAMAQLSTAPLSFSEAQISTAATIGACCQALAVQCSPPLGLVVVDVKNSDHPLDTLDLGFQPMFSRF